MYYLVSYANIYNTKLKCYMGEVMGSHKGVKAIVKDSEHIEFHNMVNPEKFENLEDAKKRQFELVIINHLPQN